MRDRSSSPHPGPFRVARVDGESAAILVAVAFVVLGVVILPVVRPFLAASVIAGIIIAVAFRLLRKKPLFPARFFSEKK